MKLLHHCGAILTLLVTLIALYCAPAICRAEEGHWTQPCDVVWTTPSHDAAGSMPLGNGEVGINLWVEPGGDLVFYISRSDSLSEVSRLLKVGGIRVSFSPNPFTKNAPFQQHLRLRDGVCEITEGDGDPKLTLRVFVDADQPVVHVTGESASPLTVKAVAESWRTQRRALPAGKEEQGSSWTLHNAPFDLIESADIFPDGLSDAVAWYHRNEESTAFVSTLKIQSLESAADRVRDPLLHRTFGGWLTGINFKPVAGHAIQTTSPIQSFALRIAAPCAQTPTPQAWLDQAQSIAAATADAPAALDRTANWWHAYWDRAWVITDAARGLAIPGNEHPLRIGYDSDRQNKFPGQLGRTSAYSRALTADEVAKLAAMDRDQPAPITTGLIVSSNGSPLEIPRDQLSFSNGLTLEAWINPEKAAAGRIFDRITAGGTDGFLLDLEAARTLRLIVGNSTMTAGRDRLQLNQWHHVAATIDPATGAICIYLNGKVIAERPGSDISPVMRGYTLQRYVQACGGRGAYPIKFNGGIFTVEPKPLGKPFNPDFRNWGDCHWWQNVRHMYHPMLAGGDFEMMQPLFNLYESVRPLCEARAKLYHNADGCYFPETMTVWGTYSNGDYGWNRTGHEPKEVLSPWWQYAWNQGPELVGLMLDRWDYTGDQQFLQSEALPMAESVLKYFDTRFHKTDDGKIILSPTQSVETYWNDVTNDMPCVAGLTDITTRLCALPEALVSPEQHTFFAKMKAACPAIPMETIQVNGQPVRKLAAAQSYRPQRTNVENPELYAIWPFRLFGLGKPGLDEARAAYTHRVEHLDTGWGYDGNCAALLGLTEEAARILTIKCANSNPAYRWPATWGPNFDWLPDQNHGGNLLETTELMLLQDDGQKIRLLPAWPPKWNVSFKLHAQHQTIVECTYQNGKIVKLQVTPESRRKDVLFPDQLSQ